MAALVQRAPTHHLVAISETGTEFHSYLSPTGATAAEVDAGNVGFSTNAFNLKNLGANLWGVPVNSPGTWLQSDSRRVGEAVKGPVLITPGGAMTLIVVAGQSNASGRGTAGATAPTNASRLWLFDDQQNWVQLSEPADAESAQQIDIAFNEGVAVGNSFATSLADTIAGGIAGNVGVLMAAKGATSTTDWQRGTHPVGRGTLYGGLLGKVRHALRYPGVTLGAIVWSQGPRDATEVTPTWDTNMDTFIADLRADLSLPNLPIIYEHIPPTVATPTASYPSWATVRTQQAGWAQATVPKRVMVDPPDGPFELDGASVHFTTPTAETFGASLGAAYLAL